MVIDLIHIPLNAAHGLETELRVGKNNAKSPFPKLRNDIFPRALSRYSLHCFCHFRIVLPAFMTVSLKAFRSNCFRISMDPVASIEILKQFDLNAFSETVMKAGSTIRKWQKQCKEYRERARGKISFRNFGKGDLALFLPTRNSVSRPWAAFNGMCIRSITIFRD